MDFATLSRRSLLKVSSIVGGGMMLQMTLPAGAAEHEEGVVVRSKELNVYVKIESSGEITIFSSIPEMGQGVRTSLPMIIAEEMGAKWEDVKVIEAPLDEKYGLQGAGGSTSIPRNFDKMRRMGASAREMLIGAAALLMEVDREGLEARDSTVVHSSGESRTFGQLATLAAEQPVPDPEMLSFKDPRSYTIIGTSVGGVDNLVIATGQTQFGIDVSVPDMHYASYTRCPRLGGKAISFNEKAIKALPGVTDAFIVEPDERAGKASMFFMDGLAVLHGGVAIVGQDTWSVFDAKSKLNVKWDESDASEDDWSQMIARAKEIAAGPAEEMKRENKELDAVFSDPSNKLTDAFYQFPYVAHVCMEPMNCTAHFKAAAGEEPDSLEIWYGSQFPSQVKEIAKNMLDIEPENVTVHPQRLGGGFGRRALHDYAAEAMIISKRSGVPVKLTWTRTDDIHNDFFRAGGFQQLKGAVNAQGQLVGLDQHYIGFKYPDRVAIGSGLRGNELTMAVMENTQVRQTMMDLDTQCGAWRAPGSNTNAFVEQSFLHELAVLGGRDYLDFLLEVLGESRWVDEGNVNAINTGRAKDVIKRAAQEAGWGREMPAGKGLGLAFYFCHAAHIAEVAEVTVNADRSFSVDKVTVAVDVGPIINRSGAINQVEGSIVDGLSTMALQQITMANGEIQETNFHDYHVMRIAATPAVDVHFIESDNPSTGIGEPALPPLAPAVTNAIFAATGERIRTMPLTEAGFRLV